MNLKQKQLISMYFPELAGRVNDTDALLSKVIQPIVNKMIVMKGDKGDAGKDGFTPIKGKDYWTEDELDKVISYILNMATPKKGVHYFDGESIKGDKGKDGKNGRDGKDGKDGKDGRDGRDAVIDTKKLIEPFEKKIEDGMALLQGRLKLIDQRWHGAGLSKVSHGNTLIGDGTGSNPIDVDTSLFLSSVSHDTTLVGLGTTASPLSVVTGGSSGQQFQLPISGVADGVNQTFTWATAPSTITVDQARTMQRVSSDGTVNWTGTTTTVLTIAPTFDIYSIGSAVASVTVLPYKETAIDYTVLTTDYTINCTDMVTITLPTAIGFAGQIYNIKSSNGSVTVNTTSGQLIDGQLTQTVLSGDNMQVQSTGTGWIIL